MNDYADRLIRFSAANIRAGKLSILMDLGQLEDEIFFSVPSDFHVGGDCLAASLATLCGKNFSKIQYDFPVSQRCIEAISIRTGASVSSNGSIPARQPGSNIVLNFSGGFDSLAASRLACEAIQTIAVDFGGPFQRERNFFETLSPTVICETDFRKKGYDRNDWMFMGAASILFADYLDLASIAFGTIFEASLYNFRQTAVANSDFPFINAVGLSDATFTRGLTEFATAIVMERLAPDLIASSVASLAGPMSEKRLRKYLLIDAVRHRYGGQAPCFDDYEYPRIKLEFGRSYAIDFLAVVFARLYGKATVSRWIDGIDQLSDRDLCRLDVDWVFRLNPLFDRQIPLSLRDTVEEQLALCGVERFHDGDWNGYNSVKSLLSRWHKFPL